MDYFLVKPDYTVLSKYIAFQDLEEEFNQNYADGYPLIMDWYYTEEHIKEVEDGFKDILQRNGLLAHYDNLLLILLLKLQEFESTMMTVNINNRYRKGIKELSQMLLAYLETPDSAEINLQIKPQIGSTVKITDQKLSRWIGKLIKETIENGKYKLSDLGFEAESLLLENAEDRRVLDIDKLKTAGKLRLDNTSKIQKELIAGLCFFLLLPYLDNETHLKKADDTNFSDAQLTFLYDVLTFFTLIPAGNFDKSMDYEPKDFMRNYLIKYAKSHIKSGNQVKKK